MCVKWLVEKTNTNIKNFKEVSQMSEKMKNLVKATDLLKTAVCDYLDAKLDFMSEFAVVELGSDIVSVDSLDEVKKTTKTTEKPAKKSSKKSEPEVDDEDGEVSGSLSREQLDGMKYNDMKKLAKDLGISAKGSREDLVERLLNTEVSTSVEDDEEDEEPVKKPTDKKKKPSKKSEPVEDEDEDDDIDDEDDSDEDNNDLDEITSKVEELVADMEVEDIAEILTEAGIKAKGKKQALIDKLIQAVADGIIELDESDDDEDEDDYEEDESEEDEDSVDEDEDEEDDDDEEEEDVNDLENGNMPKERKKALIALDKKLRKQFTDKKLKTSTMKKALVDYYGEDAEDEIDDMDKEDLLDAYIYVKQLYVDDDGEMVDVEEPYTVNGVDYCCGTPLEYDKKSGSYICPVCNSKYGEN